MSARSAQTIVLVVGAGLFTYTVIRDVLRPSKLAEGATYKQLWTIAGVTLMLTLLADFAPAIAGPFAVAVGLAYVAAGPGVSDLFARAVPTAPGEVTHPV